MIRLGQHFKQILLAAGDYAVFAISLALALALRYNGITPTLWNSHLGPFLVIFFCWLLGFYVVGLYNLKLVSNPLKLFRSYTEGMIVNMLIAFAYFYLHPNLGIAPRTNLLLIVALTLFLGYAWRLTFLRSLDQKLFKGRVLYIGPRETVPQTQALLASSTLGLTLGSVFLTNGEADPRMGLNWIQDGRGLEEALREQRVSIIVLGVPLEEISHLHHALYRSLFHSITLIHQTELEEVTRGRIPLTNITDTWFIEHLRESEKTWYDSCKRILDISLAIPFGIITLVFLPVVALLIRLSSPGPIFYKQERVGKHGQPIWIWKFRTMLTDAEKDGPQFTSSTKTDPRVTRIGRVFRQLRIDELPQIWNVFRGDLSFIGPRPERPEFVAPLVERMPYYQLRHLTRPGLTGWAQVQWLKPTSTLDDNLIKLQYDLYYIKNRSLLLDFSILLKTIGIVLRRQGT